MDHLLQSIAVLLIASFPICMYAYPNGQVASSCSSMIPQHGASSQTSSAPYTLSLDKNTYSAGDRIKVTLGIIGMTQFRGFLIQARSGSSSVPVGTFVTSNSNTQTLTCSYAASSVSHKDASGKSSVDVTWVAPASTTTDVQIRATVVQSEQVFWTNVVSVNIAYVPITSTPSTTVRNLSTTNTTVGNVTINTTANTTVGNVTINTTANTTVGKTSTINTTVKTDPSTSTVRVIPTSKPSSTNKGVQSTWTLEALILSCGILMASLLA